MTYALMVRHYFKRITRDHVGTACLFLLPVALVALFTVISNTNFEGTDNIVDGFNVFATGNTMMQLVMFQFFNSMIITDFMYADLRTDMRWRLLASPQSFSKFIFSGAFVGVVYSIISGLFILGFGVFVFNANWGTLWVTLSTLLVLAILNTLFGLFLFLSIGNKNTTNAIAFGVAFGQTIPMNFMNLNNDAVRFFFERVTPFGIGSRVIVYGSTIGENDFGDFIYKNMAHSMLNLGILVGLCAILAIAIIVISRRRSF